MSYGERSAAPNGLGVNLTQIVWSTPFTFHDTRLSPHSFGNGFNISYPGGFPGHAGIVLRSQQSSLDQRAAVTYAADGYNLTANLLNGLFFADPSHARYPNWLKLDLTVTKNFGRLEFGPAAFASTDLGAPTQTYRRESQIALGGFASYDFGPFVFQTFLTRDLARRGYAG